MRAIALVAEVLALLMLVACNQAGSPPVKLPPPANVTGPQVRAAQYGQPVTVEGASLAVGHKAPDARLRTPANRDFDLSSLRGKVVLISVVPELGTTVCDRSTQRFDQLSRDLDGDVAVVVVSTDDPFTQDRWLREHDLRRVKLLSDSVHHTFGPAYGLQIKETRRLGRAVLIIDRQGTIRYIETQRELARDPSYDAAAAMMRQLEQEKAGAD